MIATDVNLLRSLFVRRGMQQQDVAEALHMSENSIVRMLKGLPVQRRTANQVAELVEQTVEEIFDKHAPKEHAVIAVA